MNLAYPSKVNLDSWQELGNDGWDWDSMLPYYKRFATHHQPNEETKEKLSLAHLDSAFDGTDGPIQCSYPKHIHPIYSAWGKTFRNLDYTSTTDFRSGKNFGQFDNACTITADTAERSYSANAYYLPVAARKNLVVVTEALVQRIVLEGESPVVAQGVQYLVKGKIETAQVKKEVILSAGSFGSPQILELSGIGSKSLLESRGIELRVDNPNVGENLQDHVVTGISFEAADDVTTMDAFRDPTVIQSAMKQYMTKKQGPLTAVTAALAFLPLVDSQSGSDQAMMKELLEADALDTTCARPAEHRASIRRVLSDPTEPSTFFCMVPVQTHLGGSTRKFQSALSDPRNFVTVLLQHLHPYSTGSVHITSPDAAVHPAIDPRYLTHPMDLEIMARHLRYIPTVVNTEPLKSFIKPDGARIPESGDWSTLDKAKEFVRRYSNTFYHPTSTCAMLPRDKGGVVDTRLRVYGVKGLRVVDASVFPLVTAANPVSTVYALAERAADMIKQDWGLQFSNGHDAN